MLNARYMSLNQEFRANCAALSNEGEAVQISRSDYQRFCAETGDTLFRSADWLDAVCDGIDWYPIGVIDGGKLAAALPVCVKKKFGLKFITVPKNTQRFALTMRYPANLRAHTRRISYEHKILQALVGGLPNSVFTQLELEPESISLLPFYWNGFTVEQRQTYVIPDISDLDKVNANYDADIRRQVKRGQDYLEISNDLSANEFFDFHQKVLRRRGQNISYPLSHIQNLERFAVKTGKGLFLCARDKSKTVVSAIFVAWDDGAAYHLFQAVDSDYKQCNPLPALVDGAIRRLAHETKSYDFEGGMTRNVELSYRRFGSLARHFVHVERYNSKLTKAILSLR